MKQAMPRSCTGCRKGALIESRINVTLSRQLECFTNTSNWLDHLRRLNEAVAHFDESCDYSRPRNMLLRSLCEDAYMISRIRANI